MIDMVKSPEFMSDREVLDSYLSLREDTSARLLERAGGARGIIEWLDNIQIEKDWRKVRVYLELLEEAALHLDTERIRIALDSLYEMFYHQSGTVRSMAAVTAGHLVALCGEEMGEAWSVLLRKTLFPEPINLEKQKNWTAYILRLLLKAILERTEDQAAKKMLAIYEAYFKSSKWGDSVCINLMSGILELPYSRFTNLQRHEIFGFVRQTLSYGEEECRLLGLLILKTWLGQGWKPQEDEKRYMERMTVRPHHPYAENYLKRQIRIILSGAEDEDVLLTPEHTSALIQKNLHLDNIWVSKVVHLEIIRRRFLGLSRSSVESGDMFQYATHLLNILCMNTDAVVFRTAGEALVEIVPHLEGHLKYEIFQEALKEIEMGMDSSNYIPSFLGRTFAYLTKEEQESCMHQFRDLMGSQNPELAKNGLEIVCEIIRHVPGQEQEQARFLRGILCQGLFSFDSGIAEVAFYLLGTGVFAKTETNGAQIRSFFNLARKILIFWNLKREGMRMLWPHLVFTRVSAFLEPYKDQCDIGVPDRVAFFSGSFDPFSEKDVAIVREIRNMDFSVCLYTHEFAWYKNTQPAHIRRQIIYMSIADMDDVYLIPESITVNTDNEEDLKKLQGLFPDKEVFLVAERDDIETNESYWKDGGENALCRMPHIIFEGNHEFGQMDSVALRQLIRARSIFLQLPSRYRDYGSDVIQQRIAEGKKISEYLNPQVQSMVLEWGLYKDKPIFKRAALTKPIDVQIVDLDGLEQLLSEKALLFDEVLELDDRDTFVVITDGRADGSICGVASFREQTLQELYAECEDFEMVSAIGEQVSGQLLLLTGIYGGVTALDDYRKMVLQELLAYCQTQPYSYMLSLDKELLGHRSSPFEQEIDDENRLRLVGFLPFEGFPKCKLLDMRHAVVLFLDTASVLREPYNQKPEVAAAIRRSQERIQSAANALYPGMLILAFEADILNHRMINLIRSDNHCDELASPEALGKKVYVPFGKILKGVRIPNTITKELNTEKIYAADLSEFAIREFPEYPSLISQIRNINSFAKPIVFVDDIYHKGYRIHQIGKIMENEGMKVGHMITGVLSGRGRNLARKNGIEIDAVHYVPNMQAWILESDMYPFIGGDGIESGNAKETEEHSSLLPSINFILPYQMPSFMKKASAAAIYRLSEVSLENAEDLYLALEKTYQEETHRSLTAARLGEVLSEPRYPEGVLDRQNQEIKISELLRQEMKKLKRLERMKLL